MNDSLSLHSPVLMGISRAQENLWYPNSSMKGLSVQRHVLDSCSIEANASISMQKPTVRRLRDVRSHYIIAHITVSLVASTAHRIGWGDTRVL